MRKLLEGIVESRGKVLPGMRETFATLAQGQHPDTLMLACADARVVPNLFASTHPGDLFVVRNVGNLVPPFAEPGRPASHSSAGAAIEFALLELGVADLIVCGHSNCGAMQELLAGKRRPERPHLEAWLVHGRPSLERFRKGLRLDPTLPEHDQLSQVNVLQQLENLRSYAVVSERLTEKRLRLHAWWFDVGKGDVYFLDEKLRRADLIDEAQVRRYLDRLTREEVR